MMMEIEPSRPQPSRPEPSPRLSLEDVLPRREWNFSQEEAPLGFNRGSSSGRPRWVLLAWSGFATCVDLLISFSLTCLFAYIITWLSPVSMSEVSLFIKTSFKWGFCGSVLLVYMSYLLIFRVFAGCTVGEWACGIRLGEPRHRVSNDYSLRVIQRFFLVLFTGIITLPLISVMIGDDMAGRLCGLPLVMQLHH